MLATKTLDRIRIRDYATPDWLRQLIRPIFSEIPGNFLLGARDLFPSMGTWLQRYGVLALPGEEAFACHVLNSLSFWEWDAETVAEFAAAIGCRYLVEDAGMYEGVAHRLVTLYAPESKRGLVAKADASVSWLCAPLQSQLPPWLTQTIDFPASRFMEALRSRFPELFQDETEAGNCFGPNELGRVVQWQWRGLEGQQWPFLVVPRFRDSQGFSHRRDATDEEVVAAKQIARRLGIHVIEVRRPEASLGMPARLKSLRALAFTPVPVK
jgi:hypothetical protein